MNMQNRRKVKKRRGSKENSRMKFSWFIGIIILAVFLGFLTARFVIGPLIGYDADESPVKIAGESKEDSDDGKKDSDKDHKEETEDKSDDKTVSATPTDGYALQFGAFSTKEAAEKLADVLRDKGINTEIVQVDNVFKVISPVVDTKKKALTQLDEAAEKEVTDVFIATFG